MAWRKGSAHATTKPSDPLLRPYGTNQPNHTATRQQLSDAKAKQQHGDGSIFLGQFGIDRFFVGDTMMGVLKLITCGGCGIWTIIDWFLIMGVAKYKNYARFNGIF